MSSFLDQCFEWCKGVPCSSFSLGPQDEKFPCVVKNGEFVTLEGWTPVTQSGSSQNGWVNQVSATGPPPDSFIVPFPAPCPSTGPYALWTVNLGGQASSVLYQDILIPENCTDVKLVLSFDWFALDANLNTALSPQPTMDFNSVPNFQFRVDLVPVSYTDWFSQNSDEGIIENLVPPSVSGDLSIDEGKNALNAAPWVHAHFDVSEYAGKQVRLAFRVVSAPCNSDDALYVGLANVRLRQGIKHVFGPGITVATNGIAPLTCPVFPRPVAKSKVRPGINTAGKRKAK